MPTVLLCHCDGTNGSTTFTDVSPSVHTMTAQSGTVVTTAQVKFGTGAASFPTVNASRLAITGTLTDFDFQSAPFTIEAWAYVPAAPGIAAIVAQFVNTGTGGWFFGSVTGNVLAFWYCNTSSTLVQFNSATTIPTGGWHFYTVDRDAGGTLRLYLDGAVVASTSAPAFLASAALQTNIGNSNRNTDDWTAGFIDEVRITKGEALYAGAFTPPTAPFPDGVVSTQVRAMVLA